MSTFLIVEDDALHRNFLREVIATSDLGCTELIEADGGRIPGHEVNYRMLRQIALSYPGLAPTVQTMIADRERTSA